MASAKKPKYSLDGLNTIMSGVAAEEKLPDIRPLDLSQLYVGPQPRQLLGSIENLGPDPSKEDWAIPLTDLLKHLTEAATQNRKSVAGTSFTELEQMAQSITQHGLLQPILVRYLESDGHFIVTDGHRRALASLIAGETKIEAKIKRSWTSEEVLAEQLIANLQRKDLTALELARAIAQLRSLYAQQIGAVESKLHPNQLLSRVWDRLEESLGLGRRQLQRLMQLNEMVDGLDSDILGMASDLRERQLRPFFKLSRDDQPQALLLASVNKERPHLDFEKMVERRLRGDGFREIALDLEMNLPDEFKTESRIPDNSSSIPNSDLFPGFSEDYEEPDEMDAYRVRNVLGALKRLPSNPEPLLRRLDDELSGCDDRERRKRLLKIENIEQEASRLSRRLAEIRKKYIPAK